MKIFHRTADTHAPEPSYRRFLRHVGRSPFTDWAFICFAFAFVLVVFVAMGVWSYRSTDERLRRVSEPVKIAPVIDAHLLEEATRILDARDKARTNLLRGFTFSGDPSL